MNFLVLEHGNESQLGLFGVWAQARGHSLKILHAHELSEWPDPRTAEAIVSFGSYASVPASADPWIAEEIRFLAAAHREGLPILGICFGAQTLAAALGGTVFRAGPPAISWEPPEVSDAALIPPGPWFRWHEDTFSLPPGARELASSNETLLAFQLGSSIGLQFHPEAEEDLVGKWIEAAEGGSTLLPVDPRALLAETGRASSGAAARAMALFDSIARHWHENSSRS